MARVTDKYQNRDNVAEHKCKRDRQPHTHEKQSRAKRRIAEETQLTMSCSQCAPCDPPSLSDWFETRKNINVGNMEKKARTAGTNRSHLGSVIERTSSAPVTTAS